MACNPQGIVQAGVHAVVLDAAMSFAVNAGLSGKDRTGAALELKTETMRPANAGERLAVRGAVMRQAKQVAFAEARIEDSEGASGQPLDRHVSGTARLNPTAWRAPASASPSAISGPDRPVALVSFECDRLSSRDHMVGSRGPLSNPYAAWGLCAMPAPDRRKRRQFQALLALRVSA